MLNKFKIFGSLLSVLIFLYTGPLLAKPFKRVLVISGGGANPGTSLGIIAGVQEKGWKPDLIITLCGSSIGASIYNSEQKIKGAFDVVTSPDFFREMNRVVIDTSNGITLIQKLQAAKNVSTYPDIFRHNLLYSPNEFSMIRKNTEFNTDPQNPKQIIISSKALFGPEQVGLKRAARPLFQEVYFTDPETAQILKDRKIPRWKSYPFTNIAEQTQAIDTYDTDVALRASIADPYLMNPRFIKGSYYFTGAVDLYPLDLALELGDEVIATYPEKLFLDYERVAINSAYGFDQSRRALEAIQYKNVNWIDVSGSSDVSFNPKPFFILMQSGIPTDPRAFNLGIGKQWSFGRDRANETVNLIRQNKNNFLGHLRKPINPKLLQAFTCKNANEWSTEFRGSCVTDHEMGCDRSRVANCKPLR